MNRTDLYAIDERSLAEITTEAMKILCREIGVVDTLRFVRQYTTGYGDYTAQREQLFAGTTLDRIVEEIKGTRKHGHSGQMKKVPHMKTTRSKRNHSSQAGRQKTI
ncbi:MAG: hypothetical protein ABFE01_02960 [Phycisphaerales bacterium]|jgi:hypothetical protein